MRASSSRREGRERPAAGDRLADQPGDDPVRLAERDAAAHEQVGDVGRGDHLVARGLGQPLALEGDALEHPRRGREAEVERVDGVEQALLVLLHVLVVGQREAVHHAVQRRSGGRPPAAPCRAAARPRRGSSSAA